MAPNDSPSLCCIDFQLSVSAIPWDEPSFCVQEITGTLKAMTSDMEEVQAGTIKLLLINAAQATNERTHLLDVCDAHSGFLESLYWALFDEEGEIKQELDIEPCWDDLLVLWEFDVPDQFRKSGIIVQAFETAIAAFASMDLTVAAMESKSHHFTGLDLTVEEWRQLGFIRIAGSQFAFRDNCKKNPYSIEQE